MIAATSFYVEYVVFLPQYKVPFFSVKIIFNAALSLAYLTILYYKFSAKMSVFLKMRQSLEDLLNEEPKK